MKKVNLVCLIMGMVWFFVGSVSAFVAQNFLFISSKAPKNKV